MNRRARARAKGPARGFVLVGFWTFFIALGVTLLSTAVIAYLPVPVALALILVIVAVGIIADMIGLAAAAAVEAPFHAMAAKKGYAARQAIAIVHHADFVSSICSDLIGDVCGTVSGAAAAAIVFRIAVAGFRVDRDLLSVLMVSAVAALTVGGKAAGKGYALDRANYIVYRVAVFLAGWQRTWSAVRRLGRGPGGNGTRAARSRHSEGQEVEGRGRRPNNRS